MEFYHDLVTQKSWQLLQRLRKKYSFVLIGGWAVFLFTKTLKSKDVDLIFDYQNLEKFREEFEVVKNERLKKYEAKEEGIDIDIYVPYYSNPGLPAEEISQYVTQVEGFFVPQPEVLAILKAKAFSERRNSPRGRKDLIDLVCLLRQEGFDFGQLKKLAQKFGTSKLIETLREAIEETNEIEELLLNPHQMKKLKKMILDKLLQK